MSSLKIVDALCRAWGSRPTADGKMVWASSVRRTALSRYVKPRMCRRGRVEWDTRTSSQDKAFEALLRYLRDTRGFDFTGYKRTSLMRRVRHRMSHIGLRRFEQYLDVLQASPTSSRRCSTRS